MSNISKIKISGTSYDIKDENACNVVELTQAEYDALPATAKTSNSLFVITDAQGVDLSNYYTKSETSGATQISTALASKADKSEIPSLDGYATETWVEGKGYLTEHQDISGKLDVSAFNTYSGSVNTQLNSKASESDLNALNDTVTAHTANASIHVTSAEKTAWNAKSDFSGNYNDLSNKPTIPSKTSDLTNDSDFATTGDVQTATNDMATKTWVGQQGYLTQHQDISGKQDVSGMTAYTKTSAFTAHTADTSIHVTSAEKATWNAKSDFSGNYNDLTNKPTIPTVPTSNTAFTNDAGYITSSALDGYATTGDVQTATADMATKTWVGNQGYLTEHQSLSNYYTKSETSGATEISTALGTKQDTLVSGTNIKTINNESILGSGNIEIQGGGGKSIEAGRGITVITGETADTVSFNLPISGGTGASSIIEGGNSNKASGPQSHAEGLSTTATSQGSHAEGYYSKASNTAAHAEGNNTNASGYYSHSEGSGTIANGQYGSHAEGHNTNASGNYGSHAEGSGTKAIGQYGSHAEGRNTKAINESEHASGRYNISSSASTTWGDSGNTLFSVGNGTADDARHNAFEIRQNGDIYCSDGTNDVKLQDTITATAANTTALGGLKLVKLTQSEYDALATKNSNTLYIING